MVLNVMREVVRYAEDLGDREPLGIVRTELSQWFPGHAEMMDAALVYTMQQRGFDPKTGECRDPIRPAAEATDAVSACGSTSCGH